ncbi:hypothetical protein QPM17_21695 [Marinobacter sp. TBZ242]|uniref:Uncharacterized protein n=1 Tax=Marinobacter azerbaijanicus TaxID=3050455 RepID=A0ABT7IHX0_9GAMM|nr:hypothetical protein [Marinobacter sp. TBZ242]MDL0433763.1 hypothetical protein [Marinobacter sp. TBZ242]
MNMKLHKKDIFLIEGARRGALSNPGSARAIIAEGLRHRSHISHLSGAPRSACKHLDGPVRDPNELYDWISYQMQNAKNSMHLNGRVVWRTVRRDAIAIGAIVARLPETMEEFDSKRFVDFSKDFTDWARKFLAERGFQAHFRLEHLDVLHPELQIWFTPYGVNQGDGTWSFAPVMGKNNAFNNRVKERFYREVWIKYENYCDYNVGDGARKIPDDFPALCSESVYDGGVSRINVNEICRLRQKIQKMEKGKELLEKKLVNLEEINLMISSRLDKSEARSVSRREKNAELLERYNSLCTGANLFLTEGVWKNIIPKVLQSAIDNIHHLELVTKEEWKMLVVEDALSKIKLLSEVHGSDVVGFWVDKALDGFCFLEVNNNDQGFKAFK